MNKTIQPLLVLALASLACMTTLPQPLAVPVSATQTPATALPTDTPRPATTEVSTFTVTGNVYIRNNMGDVIGWAEAGDTKAGECLWRYCWLADGTGKIWRGCTDKAGEMECKSE